MAVDTLAQTAPSGLDVSATDSERRREDRQPCNWPAHCHAVGAGDWQVTIVDASQGGFGLSCDLPLERGTRLDISVQDVGVFPCRIAWKNGDRCGLELLREDGFVTEDQADQLTNFL